MHPALLLVHPAFYKNAKTAPVLSFSFKKLFYFLKTAQCFFLHCCASSPSFSLFGAQCFVVFSSFPCDRLGSVKVKVSVFIVAVVGSSAVANEVCICIGCAFWWTVKRTDQLDP